ncbi:SGNH/GDSL hydrolase family protein [Duganella sp. S19_KUP01_CR8]|uniref:SGNH/GDSL hydrolase family protein n=1 Tax=Duganella sp. S19_KUP01_CR8 TaxID=3025502 RepID=UPI002FCDC786
MAAKHVLCYGDSMSWGIIPGTRQRHPHDKRWTGILQQLLGDDVRVIEECLNGRTTVWNDPFRPGRNGKDLLLPILHSHAPIDLVIIFLGTNDLQSVYGVGAYESSLGAGALVDMVQACRAEPMQVAPQVLLLAPPRIVGLAGTMVEKFHGAEEKSIHFTRCYARIAEERGCSFLDAAEFIEPSETDGVHLDELQHRQLAEALHHRVLDMLEC